MVHCSSANLNSILLIRASSSLIARRQLGFDSENFSGDYMWVNYRKPHTTEIQVQLRRGTIRKSHCHNAGLAFDAAGVLLCELSWLFHAGNDAIFGFGIRHV